MIVMRRAVYLEGTPAVDPSIMLQEINQRPRNASSEGPKRRVSASVVIANVRQPFSPTPPASSPARGDQASGRRGHAGLACPAR
jgi:hypothetical protein